MYIQWENGTLRVQPKGEGERIVLERVVDSLAGLNLIKIDFCSPSGPNVIDLVDNEPVCSGVDESLQVIP
jgi:hypothetical protein